MRGLELALEESFAWQLICYHAEDQWRRGKFILVGFLILTIINAGLRLDILAVVIAWYAVAVLIFAGLNCLLWITFGRLVTTRKEREALSARERVNLAHTFWWRHARKAKS